MTLLPSHPYASLRTGPPPLPPRRSRSRTPIRKSYPSFSSSSPSSSWTGNRVTDAFQWAYQTMWVRITILAAAGLALTVGVVFLALALTHTWIFSSNSDSNSNLATSRRNFSSTGTIAILQHAQTSSSLPINTATLIWSVPFVGNPATNYLDVSPSALTAISAGGTPIYTTCGFDLPTYDNTGDNYPYYGGLPLGCEQSFTVNFWWTPGTISSSNVGTGGLICADAASPTSGCGNWFIQFGGYGTTCGIVFYFDANRNTAGLGTACVLMNAISFGYPNHIAFQWQYAANLGGVGTYYVNGTAQPNTYPPVGVVTTYTCETGSGGALPQGSSCGQADNWNFNTGVLGGQQGTASPTTQYVKIGCNYPATGVLSYMQIWLNIAPITSIYIPSQATCTYHLPSSSSTALSHGSSPVGSTSSIYTPAVLLWSVSYLGSTSTNYLDTSPNPLTEANQHGTPTFTTTGYQFPAYDAANSPFPAYAGLPLGCKESFTVNFWWQSGTITSSDTGTGGLLCGSQANPSDGCGDWLVQFSGYLASPTSTNCGINFFFGAGDSGGLAGTPNGGCIPYLALALTYPTHVAIQWVYNPALFGNGLASFYINGTLLSNTYPTTGSGNIYQCTSDGTQTCDGSAWNFAVGTAGGSFSQTGNNQYIKIGCNYPANGLLWDAQIWAGTAPISTLYNASQA